MSEVFKAISDPIRREVLNLLKEGPLNASELHGHFDVSKPAMSKHFSILKQADLIYADKKGNQIWYCLNISVLENVLMQFMSGLKIDGDKNE